MNMQLLPIISIHLIQQTGDETTQIYQVEVVTYIKHQILLTDSQWKVWPLERRINSQILGVKGLTFKAPW